MLAQLVSAVVAYLKYRVTTQAQDRHIDFVLFTQGRVSFASTYTHTRLAMLTERLYLSVQIECHGSFKPAEL